MGGRIDELKSKAVSIPACCGRVLQEAWEALRDADGGPLTDSMRIINDLMEKRA
ncbi:hypothetical protein [Streptomyces sp. NPDC095613]|uniref:hypothetical protein n=1 Tax=Streptomyces sp. NPDC095613 TaxID=3155540 RepID=UPI003317204A